MDFDEYVRREAEEYDQSEATPPITVVYAVLLDKALAALKNKTSLLRMSVVFNMILLAVLFFLAVSKQ